MIRLPIPRLAPKVRAKKAGIHGRNECHQVGNVDR